MTTATITPLPDEDLVARNDPVALRRDTLMESVFGAALGTMELVAIYLGDRLGYYRALARDGAATAADLSRRTGTNERYTREWLEQQAMADVLEVVDTGNPATRRYSLPPGHDEVLTGADSLNYLAPLARMVIGAMVALPLLRTAYRSGGGVPYALYGEDTREGIADLNRTMFLNQLASEWIPALPDIHARLLDRTRTARVADIGCGTGWSSIAIAQGYPGVQVDGFDVDDASIEHARRNATQLGLQERVHFEVRNAGDPALAGRYDLACAFECIHDMANPVEALAAMRRLVGTGGTALIADERVADTFDVDASTEIERLMYGFSVFHCLPVGMADEPSAATGAVMRPETLRAYAHQAGFAAVDVLPIDNFFWRFYRLTA